MDTKKRTVIILLIIVIVSYLGCSILGKILKPSLENCVNMDNAFMNNLDYKSHTGTELNDFILPTIKSKGDLGIVVMYPNSVNSYGKYYNHIELIDGCYTAEVSETAKSPIKDISSLKLDSTVMYETSFIRDKETKEIIGLMIEKVGVIRDNNSYLHEKFDCRYLTGTEINKLFPEISNSDFQSVVLKDDTNYKYYGKSIASLKFNDKYYLGKILNEQALDINYLELENETIYDTMLILDSDTEDIIGLLIEKKENKE